MILGVILIIQLAGPPACTLDLSQASTLVAYPAEYGNSGVMTFIVNHAGAVYQKDLGDSKEEIAKHVKWFDPDQTWKKVDVTSLQ